MRGVQANFYGIDRLGRVYIMRLSRRSLLLATTAALASMRARAQSIGASSGISNSAVGAMGYVSGSQEAVGPFTSWVNLKTMYGAVGDGLADDTTAIQNALNDLSVSQNSGTKPPVLYVPAGTYIINSNVALSGTLGVSIVGDSPSTTTWKAGSSFTSSGTLLTINAVAHSRFTRMTFEGNNRANLMIDQSSSVPVPIGSLTYNSGTGALSLTLESASGVPVGGHFTVSGISRGTGGGSYTGLNGTWVATSGTFGATVNATVSTGLGIVTTVTGAPVVVNNPGAAFDTGNQYSDLVIQNLTGSNSLGIRAGLNGGASEGSILRCTFDKMDLGLCTFNFNALNWWVWYCSFANMSTAATNNYPRSRSGGAFHLYNCNINGPFVCNIGNTGVFNFRQNFQYNTGSGNWGILQNSFSNQAATTRSQLNTFHADASGKGVSYIQGNMGPAVQTDNFFITPSSGYTSATNEIFCNNPSLVSG